MKQQVLMLVVILSLGWFDELSPAEGLGDSSEDFVVKKATSPSKFVQFVRDLRRSPGKQGESLASGAMKAFQRFVMTGSELNDVDFDDEAKAGLKYLPNYNQKFQDELLKLYKFQETLKKIDKVFDEAKQQESFFKIKLLELKANLENIEKNIDEAELKLFEKAGMVQKIKELNQSFNNLFNQSEGYSHTLSELLKFVILQVENDFSRTKDQENFFPMRFKLLNDIIAFFDSTQNIAYKNILQDSAKLEKALFDNLPFSSRMVIGIQHAFRVN